MKVGSTLTVSGSGWEPHEPLSLTLYSADPASPGAFPNAARTHATADAQGNFTTSYPMDAQLRWNTDAMLSVEGDGPRFGYVDEYGTLMLAARRSARHLRWIAQWSRQDDDHGRAANTGIPG